MFAFLKGMKIEDVAQDARSINGKFGMDFVPAAGVGADDLVFGAAGKWVLVGPGPTPYNGNILVAGGAHSGKTSTVERPVLLAACAAGESVVVLESYKADLFQTTAKRFADAGYEITRMDLRSRKAKAEDDDPMPEVPETVIDLAHIEKMDELDAASLTEKPAAWFIILPDQEASRDHTHALMLTWYRQLLAAAPEGALPRGVTFILADTEKLISKNVAAGDTEFEDLLARLQTVGGRTVLCVSDFPEDSFVAVVKNPTTTFPLTYILNAASLLGTRLTQSLKSILVFNGKKFEEASDARAVLNKMTADQEMLVTENRNCLVLTKVRK